MSLKICVLASGSSGNCTYVASERTRILVDAGVSCAELRRRLALIDVDIAALNAVCVTHEHEDHKLSLGVLHRRTGVSLYANAGTIDAIERSSRHQGLPWQVFTTGEPFHVGDLTIEPFSVPHDSYEPVGFVVGHDDARVGIVTDMGMPTGLIRERLKPCQAIIVESNHDEQLLRDARRPWPLKQRIAGNQGHLSNDQAAGLVGDVAGPGLQAVFLAHLSSECNRPDLALAAVRGILEGGGHGHIAVKMTYQDRPSECVDILPALVP